MGRKVFLLIGIVLAAQVNVAGEGPSGVLDGLAVYKVGEGEPVFLMPYPHASASEPMALSPLARQIVASGRSVISFDAPGMFSSTRKPEITMEEMLGCALETGDARTRGGRGPTTNGLSVVAPGFLNAASEIIQRHLGSILEACQTKVRDHGLSRDVDHNVGRFNVAMNNAATVRVL